MSAGCATNTAHLDPQVHMERKLNICRVSYAHFSCMVKEHAQFLWVLLRSICLLCDSRKSFSFRLWLPFFLLLPSRLVRAFMWCWGLAPLFLVPFVVHRARLAAGVTTRRSRLFDQMFGHASFGARAPMQAKRGCVSCCLVVVASLYVCGSVCLCVSVQARRRSHRQGSQLVR